MNRANQDALITYYKDIMPNLDGFRDMLATPMPTSFWVNPLKATPSEVESLLTDVGFRLKQIPWHPLAFRCDRIEGIGKRWEYITGLIQVQEEVSMLPVTILNPQPGERVLDLCAAPGNKTAEAAVAMKNTGTLVANDVNYGRMRALGQIMKRLGLINISLHVHDAGKFPKVNTLFDKIIVDAPCSCEGTFRKHQDRVILPSHEHASKMAKRQVAILKRAVQLCRPGGRIVYSTCTFAPEENEAVVSAVLQAYPEQLKLVPIQLPEFVFSEGVTEWRGEHYDLRVKDTMRVWPHQNDTGGFYVALFEKIGGDESQVVALEDVFSDVQPEALQSINARFGFPDDLWARYKFFAGTKKGFYLTNQDNLPPRLTYDATGLFFLKMKTTFPKLTTAATMLMGKQATQNTVSLTESQVNAYLSCEEIILDDGQLGNCQSTGYVIAFYKAYPVGIGLYLSAQGEKAPRLKSLFPKYFFNDLKQGVDHVLVLFDSDELCWMLNEIMMHLCHD